MAALLILYILNFCVTDLLITSAKEVMFLPEFVRLCVSKITQRVMEGCFRNFQGMSGMAKTTSGSILGMIRKESWIWILEFWITLK